jgi:hypothetical protein
MQPARAKILFLLILALAAGTFLTGMNWGLPSRESDPILFGGRTPWTGKQIMDLAGAWEETGPRGADIAMHPLPGKRDRAIDLNETGAQRAEIVRRFRLYSAQPDEMITFRALSRMKPARLDLDPRLYQYGGLWIYPIGALLKIGSLLHLVTLRTDLAFYLDHPEYFARFYLVARAYSAAWGLLGVLVVYAIGKDWTGKISTGITAAGLFATMPVVIDLAHEAKPHLAGAVLVLITIWCAMKYIRGGQTRWWILAGVSAGAAMGMVLTGYVAFAVLPIMTLLRPISWRERISIATKAALIGFANFTLTDPYLPFNILFRRQVLHSNVGNYGTFYQPRLSWTGILFAGQSMIEGMSTGPSVIGFIGVIFFLWTRCRDMGLRPMRVASEVESSQTIDASGTGRKPVSQRAVGLLLAAPAVLVLIQFVLLADGKTAEYARFALMPAIALGICAAALIDRLKFNPREKAMGSALLIASALYFGIRYDLNFALDNRTDSTRRTAARQIDAYKSQASTIAVWAEPAPYCMPPVDLFHWKLLLLPHGSAAPAGMVSVRPIDEPEPTPGDARKITFTADPERASSPISWANKPFEILAR